MCNEINETFSLLSCSTSLASYGSSYDSFANDSFYYDLFPVVRRTDCYSQSYESSRVSI